MQKKWIFLTGLLVCLLVGGWAYYNYQKPRSGTTNASAVYKVSAEKLYEEFNTNEAAANERYNGKVISVKGTVAQVIENEKNVLVVLNGGNEMGGVSCSFTNSEKISTWPQVGETVTIKGVCSGFLMDVNLVDAVFVQ